MSVMRLIQGPTGQIVQGSIRFKSYDYKRDEKGNPVLKSGTAGEYEMEEKVYDIAKMPIHEIHRIRGKQVAMIFQEPMTSLNPVFTIGQQLDEVTLLHQPGATKASAKAKSEEMLRLVGIIPENVYHAFPHELSGGMRQRVMIAMALAAEPRLIIADEPTTALDVTIQAQILDLLQDIKNKIDGSILLITHDLGVIAEMADYVVVMYAGKVIEKGTVYEIFQDPRHPYTIGLQKSKPTMSLDDGVELYNIPGNVPNPIDMPDHCYFKERCAMCTAKCTSDYPDMIQVSPTHFVACHLYGEEESHG
jgi:peptide/nickel transport system ATP-binding protein